ncbi:hypothetical protein BS47DRAFT_1300221 [Hydnum rufescens UP504]|uniref:J domain-containing protein n=1 Tax=Hydnum rufescens UP504 TaxID=1448309 RepID=A0A9P6AR44_9AGAM|nr:hypothetical protein BS47DRAFT_1300221 [Hydnum rufescens UP504]
MSPTATAFAILRFIGWSFLPSALANVLINGYHRIVHPGYPSPRPGTPAYISQYRLSFTVLAVLYLLYTLVAAATSLPESYYEILGVDRAVDEQGLKIAFRAFARKNHPDRPSIGVDGEGRFREARDAFEALKNPVKRFAYDRFGPDVVSWKDLSTPREYIRRGLSSASGFYIGSGALLLLISILGKSGSLSFWRYVLFSTVLFAEAYLIFSPSPIIVNGEDVGVSDIPHSLPILSALLPSRLPYQHILFLHQMFISLSVCISHLGPVLLPETVMSERDIMKTTFDLSHRISLVSGIAEREGEIHSMSFSSVRNS